MLVDILCCLTLFLEPQLQSFLSADILDHMTAVTRNKPV